VESQEASAGRAADDIDPAITEAIKKEGPVRFNDDGVVESALQAHLLAETVMAIGGEAEVTTVLPAEGMAAMCKADNQVNMYLWKWQNLDPWNEYVDNQKCIVEAGTSDYAGEEGWYVPTYVIKGDPERGIEPMCPELPDWNALNKCVDVFKTAKTAPKGQYMEGAESWAPYYGDQARIDNLGLNYEMVFAGSEAALFAEFTKAYEQGKPWLGLMWRPNYMTHKFDLTRVEFPPYSDKCWGTTYACQWPETVIYHITSDDLQEKHATVWNIIQNYDLNGDQLQEMQSMVINDGMDTQEAAKTWMEENPEVWKAWL
jgi:glycine betaine/proline transport system substrate-binding protein